MRGDITERAHCIEIVDRAMREFGKLDALVNNAAYQMLFEKENSRPAGPDLPVPKLRLALWRGEAPNY